MSLIFAGRNRVGCVCFTGDNLTVFSGKLFGHLQEEEHGEVGSHYGAAIGYILEPLNTTAFTVLGLTFIQYLFTT